MERLIKCLKACAEAHGYVANYDEEFRQVIVDGFGVPLLHDLREIARAFFGATAGDCVDCDGSWGMTAIYLDEYELAAEVDEERLALALPYGRTER